MRKAEIKIHDFTKAFDSFGLDKKQQENIFKKMEKAIPKWKSFIDMSFLDDDFKLAYKALIDERMECLKAS